ncbi:Neutral ceramidase [Paraconexibacter sp. AEG42_29]|uniref:Neutral ceramidase n=1 Tax=Paraconexibacter sp. AEG42_29 TaxID=2997339 RepID=A0AAU7B2I1_9ACTN
MRSIDIRRIAVVGALAALALAAPSPSGAATPKAKKVSQLRAGAGQADITPPQTGYYLGGWTRADRLALGQSTRLYANTLVLQRGTRKIALVAIELFAVPAGLQEDVARAVADLGYDRTGILMAASHTHSGPGGYANNPTYNTAAPSPATIGNPSSFIEFIDPKPADPTLYTFLVKQIAASIRRADGDRGLAAAGWASVELRGLTENRSIEAHLANHGLDVETGRGTAAMDPLGADDTIDPAVDVLRVDKFVKRKGKTVRVPIGAYSNFADHGTVVKADSQVYSGDHHAAAWRVFVDKVRRASPAIPKNQTVVNVYPNGAEGDQTAGLKHTGFDGAAVVGSAEAAKMFEAWKLAGKRLSRTPALDVRWTRSCFCGRSTATGPVDSKGIEGAGFLTGSEEGRGPLFDLTGISLEGRKNLTSDPVQGNKVQIPVGAPPAAVPLSVTRIGDGVLVQVPGEPTKEVGVRVRRAVRGPLAPKGIKHVVIAGLAGDFIQYITTPEEYGQQSYEGASTLFGRNQATFLQERYAELAGQLASGAPAEPPYPLDVAYGVKPDGPDYPAGAAAGSLTGQPPATVARGKDVKITWSGAPLGRDRPVDKAFVSAQRLVGKRWRTVDSDLGLHMLWHVDAKGAYDLTWTVPASAPAGTYRLLVSAQRYGLTTRTFTVG